MSYFLICPDEDGARIHVVPAEKLEEVISEENMGIDPDKAIKIDAFTADPNYWATGSYLLIKGEVVYPTQVEVITKWEFP